jgi:hypothetical protein
VILLPFLFVELVQGASTIFLKQQAFQLAHLKEKLGRLPKIKSDIWNMEILPFGSPT